jgi:hypothetical protein
MAGMSSPNGATVHGLKNLAQIVVWCGMIPFHATHTHARTHDIGCAEESADVSTKQLRIGEDLGVRESSARRQNHIPLLESKMFRVLSSAILVELCHFSEQERLPRSGLFVCSRSDASHTKKIAHSKQNKSLCSFLSAHVIRHFKKNGNTAKTT